MKILNQQFRVNYHYPVYFTTQLFNPTNQVLANLLNQLDSRPEKRLLFVIDEGMLRAHAGLASTIGDYFRETLPSSELFFLNVPGGEEVKNSDRYFHQILHDIDTNRLDRHSFVVGIGGGAVLDLTGYAAAVAHRGIRHIRIPTTVLSQNDSGVGVKNGINFFGKKNFLGTFAPPVAVFNDTAFLDTLSDRHWHSGIAEAVKVALIKDAAFFSWLESHADALIQRDMAAMEYLIYRCAALHMEHIGSGDPFELGSSRPLDFGHWSAHKLEQMTSFSLTHGEAVAIGIALDVVYSENLGWLDKDSARRIMSLLGKLQFNTYHPLLADEALLDGLREFQEHLGGQLTIMLLRTIGHGENTHTMDTALIRQCINEVKETAHARV